MIIWVYHLNTLNMIYANINLASVNMDMIFDKLYLLCYNLGSNNVTLASDKGFYI